MKKSIPVGLTALGGLLFTICLAAVSVRADPNLKIKVFEPEKHEGVLFLPFSVDGLFAVKSEGKNAGWAFGLSKSKQTVGVHHLPFSVDEPDNGLFSLKSESKNAGWAFGLSKSKQTVGVHGQRDQTLGPAQVAEPTTMILLATGLAGLGGIIRKKRKGTN